MKWIIAACLQKTFQSLLFLNFYHQHHRIPFFLRSLFTRNPDIAVVLNGNFHLATTNHPLAAAVEAAWTTPRANGSPRARLCRPDSSSRLTQRVTQHHRRATWCPTRRGSEGRAEWWFESWKSWDVLHWGITGIIAESSLRISEELDGPLEFSVWTWGEIICVTGWISKPKNYCVHVLMCISACSLFMSILSLFVFEKTVDGHVSCTWCSQDSCGWFFLATQRNEWPVSWQFFFCRPVKASWSPRGLTPSLALPQRARWASVAPRIWRYFCVPLKPLVRKSRVSW